jgi:hypothetical protein
MSFLFLTGLHCTLPGEMPGRQSRKDGLPKLLDLRGSESTSYRTSCRFEIVFILSDLIICLFCLFVFLFVCSVLCVPLESGTVLQKNKKKLYVCLLSVCLFVLLLMHATEDHAITSHPVFVAYAACMDDVDCCFLCRALVLSSKLLRASQYSTQPGWLAF